MARTIAKDYSEKREQILKTAAQVFADTGFDRASMSQLAKACNISKANIYHYYDSKDGLLYDLLDTYLRALQDRLSFVNGKGMTPEEHFSELVKEVLLAYHGADNEHRVQTNALSALGEEEQKVLRYVQRQIVTQMSDVVQAIAPEKFDTDRVALNEVTMSIFGMLNWYYMWQRDTSEGARIGYADRVASLILNGIH
ncbi:MAG: TetR/AcrR family transcriptional regulator [Paracoccaceae bacterium]|jgi:AcrR family transcriptional regulator